MIPWLWLALALFLGVTIGPLVSVTIILCLEDQSSEGGEAST